MSTHRIRRITAVTDDELGALAAILVDCVEGGASVNFMLPFTMDEARAYWRGIAADTAGGRRALLVAEDDDGIVGTVHLVLDMPPNQRHRADLVKMLVHRRARRRGLGALLMHGAEDLAREHGRTLLVLDTASDEAERLYERMGWSRCGHIPGFALMPDGTPCATTLFYRDLSRRAVNCGDW